MPKWDLVPNRKVQMILVVCKPSENLKWAQNPQFWPNIKIWGCFRIIWTRQFQPGGQFGDFFILKELSTN